MTDSGSSEGRHAQRADVIIVGASLGGLMTALALSRHELDIVMLERSNDSDRTGAALQVEHGLIERLTGRRHHMSAALPAGVQTWRAVHAGLRAAVDYEPTITVLQDSRVESVGQDDDAAWAITADGRRFEGSIVVGADGYQSVVRRGVSPDKPDATFAGYLAWVGFADEAAIDAPFPPGLDFLDGGAYHLLGFPLPARDGTRTRGQRQVGWAWYDAGHNDLLRESGSVEGTVVKRSLRPASIPDKTLRHLAKEAHRHWPSPWLDAILDCIERRAILGTPVAEYVPDRLVNGRLCLVGDAAHVPTPMTGNGFSASAADAIALANALGAEEDPVEALGLYEDARLAAVRSLVQSGQRFSRSFSREW